LLDNQNYGYLSIQHMLPSLDWNIKFYGGHIGKVKQGWSAPSEAHIGFEVLMVLQGQQTTAIYGERLQLKKGDILIIPSGVEHVNACQHKDGLRYFCAHFHIDDPAFRIQMMSQQELIYRDGTEHNQQLSNIIHKWLSMIKHDQHYSSADYFAVQMILFELCVCLTSLWKKEPVHEKRNNESEGEKKDRAYALSPSGIHYARMIAERLKLYFNQHVSSQQELNLSELKVEALIESLGISSGYGLEVFRKVYGISPRKYLSELKLHEAKVLIQQSNLSFSDIAERLGYSQLSHFSRQFKRWTGLSPMDYRKLRQ